VRTAGKRYPFMVNTEQKKFDQTAVATSKLHAMQESIVQDQKALRSQVRGIDV
jgi:hypothetical protein